MRYVSEWWERSLVVWEEVFITKQQLFRNRQRPSGSHYQSAELSKSVQ
ncbi:hypothetical protein [uncultured Nostoc sp.]